VLLFIFAGLILRTGILNANVTIDLERNHFYPQWREKQPEGWLFVLLTMRMLSIWWLEHKVVFIAIPTNLSHLLDPLDLSSLFYIKADTKNIQRVITRMHTIPRSRWNQ
jgi:hypothetical protein